MTGIAFNLAQVSLALNFLGESSVTISYRGVRRLALLASSVQPKIILKDITGSFARPVAISTITVSGRSMIFISLKIFLVLKFFLFQ